MKKATKADKKLIIDLLINAFETNKSVNYVVRQGNRRPAALRALMEYSYEMCALFGDVWLSEDRKACALVLYPQNKRGTIAAILLDIKLVLNAIGISGIKKAMARENRIKEKQPQEPMYYLWFIGVNPEFQLQGIGSKLLQEVLDDAAQKKLPVYLETSTTENLSWYKRLGFEVYDQLELGYTLYFLRNI